MGSDQLVFDGSTSRSSARGDLELAVNRTHVCIEDPGEPRGWRWQHLSDYVAGLKKSAYVERTCHRGGKTVCVHVVRTQARKLYC